MVSKGIFRRRKWKVSFAMNVSLLEALSSVTQPSYDVVRNGVTGQGYYTYLGSNVNPINNMQERMRQVFAIMMAWNLLKSDQICTEFEYMLGAVWCVHSRCLDPMSCNCHV